MIIHRMQVGKESFPLLCTKVTIQMKRSNVVSITVLNTHSVLSLSIGRFLQTVKPNTDRSKLEKCNRINSYCSAIFQRLSLKTMYVRFPCTLLVVHRYVFPLQGRGAESYYLPIHHGETMYSRSAFRL